MIQDVRESNLGYILPMFTYEDYEGSDLSRMWRGCFIADKETQEVHSVRSVVMMSNDEGTLYFQLDGEGEYARLQLEGGYAGGYEFTLL